MSSFDPRMCRSPRDFEQAARDWLFCWGFMDACLTNVGPDDGIDVVASGAVAQVKAWMSPIGIAEVQRLRGTAHDGREAFFFSLMDYTDAARRFADSAGVKLFRFTGYDGSIEAINADAVDFLRDNEFLAQQSMRSFDESDGKGRIENLVANALYKASRLPGFAVFDVRESGNRYVQYVAPSHLETVGRKYIERSNPLTALQYVRLAAIGWPALVEGYGENFVYPWSDPPELEDLVAVVVSTLIEVHDVKTSEDLIVTVDV